MTIQAVDLPKSSRSPKYDYGDALDTVREMLANGQSPGDGPFESQGKARSAANSLLDALGDEGKKYGARVWEVKGKSLSLASDPTITVARDDEGNVTDEDGNALTDDEGNAPEVTDPNGWYFGLKVGRQEYHGRKKGAAKKK